MARLPIVGGDDNTWGDVLVDYLTQSLSDTGTLNDATVNTDQLVDESVTAAKIATGAITKLMVGLDNVTNDAQLKIASNLGDVASPSAARTNLSVYSISSVDSIADAKQDTLVSGTNIKTINGGSLLGTGDLTVTGTGDVVGPASSTDNAIARYDSTTGKLLQDSTVTIDDNGKIIAPTNGSTGGIAIGSSPVTIYKSATDTLTTDGSLEFGSTPAYNQPRRIKVYDDGVNGAARLAIIGTGSNSLKPAIEMLVDGDVSKRVLLRLNQQNNSNYGIEFFTTNAGSVENTALLYANGNFVATNISATNLTDITALQSGKVDKISSTNNKIARFDGSGGDLKDSSVTILDDGKVGIGSTSPAYQFEIEGDNALALMYRYQESANNSPGFLFRRAKGTQASPADIVADTWLGKLQFQGRTSGSPTTYSALGFIATDTVGNGYFTFTGSNTAVSVMSVFTNSGNVGIGTVAPSEKLHVNGNIAVTGTVDGRDIATDGAKLDGISGTNTGDQDISGLQSKAIAVTSTTARTTAAKVGTTAGGGYVPTTGDIILVTFTLGIAVSNPTLSIDGGSAIALYVDTAAVTTSLLSTAASSVTIRLWYDGVRWQLDGSHLNTNTTYSEITTAEIDAGTASTARALSGRRSQYILDKASGLITAAVAALTKSSVGLDNVDNTSDANKPISTATQTALDTKGQVNSVVAGTNITIDSTDPANPVISASGGGGETSYGSNTVANPSFETNTTGWGLEGDYFRVDTSAQDGTWSIRGDFTSGYSNFISSAIPVDAGKTYRFTFWYDLTIDSGNGFNYQINTGSAYGTPILEGSMGASTAGFTQKVHEFSSGVATEIYIRIYNNDSDATIFLDNFAVQEKIVSGGGAESVTPDNTVTFTNKDLSDASNVFPTFNQNTTGTAASATALQTPRTVLTDLSSTSTASFDGTANIAPGVSGTLPISNGGTGATTAAAARTNLGVAEASNFAKITVGTSAPSSPAINDLWVDTN